MQIVQVVQLHRNRCTIGPDRQHQRRLEARDDVFIVVDVELDRFAIDQTLADFQLSAAGAPREVTHQSDAEFLTCLIEHL